MTFDVFDRDFSAWRAAHPETTFADYYAHRSLVQIGQGIPHATLGPTLKNPSEVTRELVDTLWTACGATRRSRVLDYGCGTLRIGRYLMRRLKRRHYMGLDVSQSLLDVGRSLIVPQLLVNKEPALHVIDAEGIDRGVAFGADAVISVAVAFHVHPDEMGTYFGNLLRLAHKPGAVVAIDTHIGDGRSNNMTWAWPVEFYQAGLLGLELEQVAEREKRKKNGISFGCSLLLFRRR